MGSMKHQLRNQTSGLALSTGREPMATMDEGGISNADIKILSLFKFSRVNYCDYYTDPARNHACQVSQAGNVSFLGFLQIF